MNGRHGAAKKIQCCLRWVWEKNECCKEGIKADVRVRGYQKGWGTQLSLTLVTVCAISPEHCISLTPLHILQFTIHFVCLVCAHVCACTHFLVCMDVFDNFQELILSFHHMGSGICTQVAMLSCRHLYMVSHLASPSVSPWQLFRWMWI